MKVKEAIKVLEGELNASLIIFGEKNDKETQDALKMAIEALKPETKKCPICGSDLYEYCFMCCYEGKKVIRNEKRSRNEV